LQDKVELGKILHQLFFADTCKMSAKQQAKNIKRLLEKIGRSAEKKENPKLKMKESLEESDLHQDVVQCKSVTTFN